MKVKSANDLVCEDSTWEEIGHEDALYNRIKKNEVAAEINPLNELESLGSNSFSYDDRGNMTTKEDFTFSYDALNRLQQVTSSASTITFLYDPLGRRLIRNSSAEIERYLYDGEEEIGAVTPCGCQKNLKVGIAAIELENRPFAPIFDAHHNICGLVDPTTKKLAAKYTCTAFGEELSSHELFFNPWRYASKRFDLETNLIYFGKRYYDPELARWLTTDPAGFIDSTNFYQYVYNNPFRYTDLNGEFAIPLLIWGAGLIFPSLTTIITTAVYTAAAATVTYVGYKAVEVFNQRIDNYSPAQDYADFLRKSELSDEEDVKINTNPFEGAVDQDTIVVDAFGNAIKIPQGYQAEGTRDGKWIQLCFYRCKKRWGRPC
ncbi:MAG: RHS repeat-associated core domain-containing protein [Chlamydiota bacterium]